MNNINDPTNMTLLRIKETAEIVNAVMLNGDLSKKNTVLRQKSIVVVDVVVVGSKQKYLLLKNLIVNIRGSRSLPVISSCIPLTYTIEGRR